MPQDVSPTPFSPRRPGRRASDRTADQVQALLEDAQLHHAEIEKQKGELSQLHEQLELLQARKLEAVGRLAGGVAHDFNNLISGIMGLTQDLLDTMPAEDVRCGDLREILGASERAVGLVRQLLAFSGRQTVAIHAVDLNRLIADLQSSLKRMIGDAIELTFRPGGDLPAIHADEGQIRQIISNLLGNARDAMPRGGRVTIETASVEIHGDGGPGVAALLPGRYVCLSVSDTGAGMDAATMSRIFEPFFTTKNKARGTGFGLSTVHGVVRQHGGEITVESRLGQGTVFTLYFPAVARSSGSAAARPQAPRPSGSQKRPIVLLVEDEDIVRRVAQSRLEREGFEVQAAASGEEALSLPPAILKSVDLLVTDIVMPGINGKVLAQKVREVRPQLPVLYMSGYPEDVIACRGILDSDCVFIEKTHIVTKLAAKARNLLSEIPAASG